MAILQRTKSLLEKASGGITAEELEKMLVLNEGDREVLRKTVSQFNIIKKSLGENSKSIEEFIDALEKSGQFAQAAKVKKMIEGFSSQRMSKLAERAGSRQKMQRSEIAELISSVNGMKEAVSSTDLDLKYSLGELTNDFSKYIGNPKLMEERRLEVLGHMNEGLNSEISLMQSQSELTEVDNDNLDRLSKYSEELTRFAKMDNKSFKKNFGKLSDILQSMSTDEYRLKSVNTLKNIDDSLDGLSINSNNLEDALENLKGTGAVAGAAEESKLARGAGSVTKGVLGQGLDLFGLGFLDDMLDVSRLTGDKIESGLQKFMGKKGFLNRQLEKVNANIKSMSASMNEKMVDNTDDLLNQLEDNEKAMKDGKDGFLSNLLGFRMMSKSLGGLTGSVKGILGGLPKVIGAALKVAGPLLLAAGVGVAIGTLINKYAVDPLIKWLTENIPFLTSDDKAARAASQEAGRSQTASLQKVKEAKISGDVGTEKRAKREVKLGTFRGGSVEDYKKRFGATLSTDASQIMDVVQGQLMQNKGFYSQYKTDDLMKAWNTFSYPSHGFFGDEKQYGTNYEEAFRKFVRSNLLLSIPISKAKMGVGKTPEVNLQDTSGMAAEVTAENRGQMDRLIAGQAQMNANVAAMKPAPVPLGGFGGGERQTHVDDPELMFVNLGLQE